MTMDQADTSHALNYMNYLAVHELLELQRPVSPEQEHDEMLFIIIHQTYELWFKQILHEIPRAQEQLVNAQTQGVVSTLNRIKAILSVCIQQIDVLITMTPLQFATFRNRLESASGFQSAQFRMLEAVLGRRSPRFASHLLPQDRAEVERLMTLPSLWDSTLQYINAQGYAIPERILERDFTVPYEPHDSVREAVLAMYRDGHQGTLVLEQLVDIEVSLREWRFRHVMMVERTIGTKQGTGGSSGVGYLTSTLSQPHSFPELWQVREDF